eukprot:scaffold189081_cov35-Prasinocladus_malaysianus.AAC.1
MPRQKINEYELQCWDALALVATYAKYSANNIVSKNTHTSIEALNTEASYTVVKLPDRIAGVELTILH